MRRPMLAVFFVIGLAAVVLAAPADESVVLDSSALADFAAVDYALPGAITLIAGPEAAIAIEASKDQRDAIRVVVADGALQLSKRPLKGWGVDLEDVKIEVVYRSLDSIAVSGSGQLDAGTVATNGPFEVAVAGSGSVAIDQLSCAVAALSLSGSGTIQLDKLAAQQASSKISGSGKITLGGTVDEQSLSLSGSGGYRAAELTTAVAEVQIAGSGSAALNAAERISGSIAGSGQVRYRGTPELAVSVSGSGQIIPLRKSL